MLDNGLIDEIKRRMPLSTYVGVRPQGYSECPFGDCPGACKKKQKCQILGDHFKCYLCGRSGDIFSWIQADKDCGFAESLRVLANAAGVSLVPDRGRSRLLQHVVSTSCRYLMRHPELLGYLLEDRGLPKSLLYRYQVGYIDPEGEVLHEALASPYLDAQGEACKFTATHLLQLGFLARPKIPGAKYGSRMAGRYLFPIRDIQGRVVQVKGRQNPVLDWEGDDAKCKPLPKQPDDAPGGWGVVSHHDYLVLEEELHDARRLGYATLWEGEPDTYTAKKLGLPAYGLQGSEGLFKHAHKLKDIQKLYIGLDNDQTTERKLVKELVKLQIARPGVEIRRIVWPALAGVDAFGFARKMDANDYHVKFGATRAEFDALLKNSVLAQDLILAELGPKYDTDFVQADLRRLFRATPAQYQARFITQLAAVTGYPEQLIAFGLDPRSFREDLKVVQFAR